MGKLEEERMMEKRGAVNQYTCQTCGEVITTVNLTDGVTPMFIRCRRLGGRCEGMMTSAVYRVSQDSLWPTHVWYRPLGEQLKRLTVGERSHVEKGGLPMRAGGA